MQINIGPSQTQATQFKIDITFHIVVFVNKRLKNAFIFHFSLNREPSARIKDSKSQNSLLNRQFGKKLMFWGFLKNTLFGGL